MFTNCKNKTQNTNIGKIVVSQNIPQKRQYSILIITYIPFKCDQQKTILCSVIISYFCFSLYTIYADYRISLNQRGSLRRYKGSVKMQKYPLGTTTLSQGLGSPPDEHLNSFGVQSAKKIVNPWYEMRVTYFLVRKSFMGQNSIRI